ncbi:MAG: hypothetical protein ACI4F1_11325, partial [Bariatricus sp.]
IPVKAQVLPWENLQVSCLYPRESEMEYQYEKQERILRVKTNKTVTAGLFELRGVDNGVSA